LLVVIDEEAAREKSLKEISEVTRTGHPELLANEQEEPLSRGARQARATTV